MKEPITAAEVLAREKALFADPARNPVRAFDPLFTAILDRMLRVAKENTEMSNSQDGAGRFMAEDRAFRESQAEQMVSQVNAEVALKSLMDAELALTKARDLLRRSRAELMALGYTEGASLLIAHINDLLGD